MLWSPLANQANATVVPEVLGFLQLQDKQSMLVFLYTMKGKDIAESELQVWIWRLIWPKWLQTENR